MALRFKLVILAVFLAWSMQSIGTAAEYVDSKLSIAERLQSKESSECWDSMLELHACIGEVVMFFLNGETYIGPGCCHAVRTIIHQCQPSMLGSLGFTSEEGNTLDDYCEGADVMIPPPPSAPSLKPTNKN